MLIPGIPGLNLPAIVGAGGFVAGILVGITFHEKVVDPARFREFEKTITQKVTAERDSTWTRITSEAASSAARLTAEARRKIADDAIAAYQANAETRAANDAARIDQLEQENQDYAAQLAATGRSCPLDSDTRDFILGVRGQP